MSIFSNDTVEITHKRIKYTAPKHIFLKTQSFNTNKFGLYTANIDTFLDGCIFNCN